MSDQKIFTPEFAEKLKSIGIINIPQFFEKSKAVMVADIATTATTPKNKNLYIEGKSSQLIFQKEMLKFILLAEGEYRG